MQVGSIATEVMCTCPYSKSHQYFSETPVQIPNKQIKFVLLLLNDLCPSRWGSHLQNLSPPGMAAMASFKTTSLIVHYALYFAALNAALPSRD